MLPLLAAAGLTLAIADGPAAFDADAAQRFAGLALECVHKEYPGKIAHVLSGDQDVLPPRTLTPAFFGCYDWHSSVHGHWLLARLTRTFPTAPFAASARAALARSLTPEHIAAEVRYLDGPGRTSFERPYGLAWLLQLAAELRTWDDDQARGWSAALQPLEAAAANRLKTWLPKLTNPIRIGEHDQTAFAFGLVLDWARAAGDVDMEALLRSSIERFYLKDVACPLNYEPSGQDFLSPCLGEADLMRRVLPTDRYATWLGAFLPQLPRDGASTWLAPAVVTDPSDPKLAHLDGLNLSRAWMLLGIARGLPASDARIAGLRATAAAHREAGLRAVTGAHYEGGHWLGTFAVYLVTATSGVTPDGDATAPHPAVPGATIAERIATLTRASSWTLERAIPMTFPAHHPQGLVKIGDRLFFTSVEVTTPPRRGAGGDGFDRDTGQGVGHLFEATMDGRLVADVVIGDGTNYHPGGIDFDGRDIWVPVAEYRPNSRSIVYRVDPATRKAVEVFRFGDHLGGVACNTDDHTLHAVSWGSRWIYRFALDGSGRPTNADAPLATLRASNRSQYVDYQDCKYVGAQRMLCSGIAELPRGPGERSLQLGGIDLVDLASAAPLHQLPVGLTTPAGASLTRNPSFFEVADGGGVRAYFLPDDDKATLYVYRIQ